MDNRRFSILYILVGLLLAGGVALFLFRDAALAFLNNQADLDNVPNISVVIRKETLKTDILNSPTFTSLKNNVTNFQFAAICSGPLGAPVALTVAAPGTSPAATGTPAVATGCVQGASDPFVTPLPKTNQ